MPRKNIFKGDSAFRSFVEEIYSRFMSREWFSYADVLARCIGKKTGEDLGYGVSSDSNYGELRKAFFEVKRAIREQTKDDNCIDTRGNNKNLQLCYIGKEDDPLRELREKAALLDLKEYIQFCQDSAGFFPQSWLEYFFYGSRELLDMRQRKNRGQRLISASLDCDSKNIDWLPDLYVHIRRKQVITFPYRPYQDAEPTQLVFHPHYLKEYNGRWHLYGHAEGQVPEIGFDIPLDRIEARPKDYNESEYIPAPKGYYKDYFERRVGVSRGNICEDTHVRVRVYNYNVFKLLETRKLHSSQETIIPFGEHEGTEYAELLYDVEANIEFVARILQWGEDVEIIVPLELRKYIAEKAFTLSKRYC